jgi:hypothetical protein
MSRRRTGRLAPELGRDYVPFDRIPNQEKTDSEDIGYSADSQHTIGEDEIIEEIDEKIHREEVLNGYAEKWPRIGKIFSWHREKLGAEEKQGPEGENGRRTSPQYSPDTDKERVIQLKSGKKSSEVYRKEVRGNSPAEQMLIEKKRMIEKKREMTHRAKTKERREIMLDQLTIPR